jgi:hypothetical protein
MPPNTQEHGRAGQLPLLISATITNVRLYHILVDGGAAFNLISLATFKKLQIPMSKLTPSCPFSGVGSGSIIPHGNISLLVTFRTPENYRTESIVFDITEVNLPFKLALYQFMVVAHYTYLVLKMSSPNGIIKVHGDRTADISVLEKLQVLAAAHEATASHNEQHQAPSRLRQCDSASAPHMQPLDNEDVPVKVV